MSFSDMTVLLINLYHNKSIKKMLQGSKAKASLSPLTEGNSWFNWQRKKQVRKFMVKKNESMTLLRI